MKLHRFHFFTLTSVVMLPLCAACSANSDSLPVNQAGSPAAGMTGVSGVSGGLGAAGVSGVVVSGSGGTSVAGTGATAGASGAAVSGNGAAGAAGGDSGIPATFDTVKLVLGGGGNIMPCAAAPCHGVNGMAPPGRPLELPPNNDQQLYTNLTSYVSVACGNVKLVSPGNPAQSALIKILSGPCGMTPRMPYGCSADAGDCIPDEYIAAVTQWIMNGAPR